MIPQEAHAPTRASAMTLHRIVIGVDFSDASLAAARWTARHIARGAELVLVHAVDIPRPPTFSRGRYPPHDTLVATAREGADRRLRELSLSLGASRVWLEIRDGDGASCIADVASEYGADLVVVGAHGERGALADRLGTTAERVLRGSRAPVLVTAGALDAAPSRLLVALDDTGTTPELLDWTRYFAATDGALVTAVHVVSPTVLGTLVSLAAIASGTPQPDIPQLHVGEQQDARVWLDDLVSGGLDPKQARAEVMYGDPAHEILAVGEREHADLVILGRHGAGGARGGVLGRVADRVVRGAKCSVLVVTEESSAPPA